MPFLIKIRIGDVMKNKMKSMLAVGALTMALASGAQAQIGGKNVVLIHGFQPDTLGDNLTNQQVKSNGYNYWSDYWLPRAEARIDWDSNERVEGGIAQFAYQQVVDLARNGTCNDGCVFVTHSTGDLVARYILDNQEAWLAPLGLQPLRVLTVFDFAGAGGGTELAEAAYDLANNDSFLTWPIRAAVGAFMGLDVEPENLGVVNDLRPSKARNLATAPMALPRLRFVGSGDDYFAATKLFISGADDGVVPLHSACGATNDEGIDSCVSFIAMDGERKSVDGPDGLWYAHYPVLMGDKTSHSDTINNETGVKLTYVYNGFRVNGVTVDFDTYVDKYSPWWYFGGADYYQYVRNSENKSMSRNVYDTVNY